MFGQGELRELDEAVLAAALAEVPRAEVSACAVESTPITELLASCGIVPSKSAGRRAIDEGGAYLNNVKVTDVERPRTG